MVVVDQIAVHPLPIGKAGIRTQFHNDHFLFIQFFFEKRCYLTFRRENSIGSVVKVIPHDHPEITRLGFIAAQAITVRISFRSHNTHSLHLPQRILCKKLHRQGSFVFIPPVILGTAKILYDRYCLDGFTQRRLQWSKSHFHRIRQFLSTIDHINIRFIRDGIVISFYFDLILIKRSDSFRLFSIRKRINGFYSQDILRIGNAVGNDGTTGYRFHIYIGHHSGFSQTSGYRFQCLFRTRAKQ